MRSFCLFNILSIAFQTLASCLLKSALRVKLVLVSLILFFKFVSGVLIACMFTRRLMATINSMLSYLSEDLRFFDHSFMVQQI